MKNKKIQIEIENFSTTFVVFLLHLCGKNDNAM